MVTAISILFLVVVCALLLQAEAQTRANGVAYPGEPVPSGALRLTLLGTGTPNVNKAQVASSYLVELGDGQVFLFDVGTDSLQNLIASGVDRSRITKVFLTHLHSDHISDLPPLYAVGYRTVPLEVWGPSGQHPKYGLNATLEGMKAILGWRKYIAQWLRRSLGSKYAH